VVQALDTLHIGEFKFCLLVSGYSMLMGSINPPEIRLLLLAQLMILTPTQLGAPLSSSPLSKLI
jgi:hypothetical protein